MLKTVDDECIIYGQRVSRGLLALVSGRLVMYEVLIL
jgi:hypothetical protein